MTESPAAVCFWNAAPPLWNPADPRPQPQLDCHPHPDGGERPCLLVLPGGGYNGLAPHEAEPIAQAAHGVGLHAAICRYRVQYPEAFRPLGLGPLHDAQRAIRLLRARGSEWGITAGKLAVLGFSAGGHLCASTGVHWRQAPPPEDDLASTDCRPDALVLCYPVICTTGVSAHSGSARNLCGDAPDPDRLAFFAAEQQVDAQTPPAFLWHTADDAGVPVANSLRFAEACAAHAVPVECHVFPHGPHGLGLAEDDPVVSRWWGLCADWLHRTLGP